MQSTKSVCMHELLVVITGYKPALLRAGTFCLNLCRLFFVLVEPGSLPSGVDHLGLVTTWSQEPLCLCLCATSHLRV